MGKKATGYLFRFVLIIITLVLGAASVAGAYASQVDPNLGHSWMLALGLALPGLLVADLILLVTWLISRRWWAVVPVLALAVNFQYVTALVRIPLGGAPEGEPDLVVATYNVQNFRHSGKKATSEEISRFMVENQVDVVCLQEASEVRGFPLDSLAASFGFYPHRFPMGEHSEGLMVFSRYPILSASRVRFTGTDNRSAWLDLDVDGRRVRLFTNHLQTSGVNQNRGDLHMQRVLGSVEGQARVVKTIGEQLQENARMRARQANLVAGVIDTTRMPVIVCGDFNDSPSSYTYQRMLGSLKDGFKESGRGYGSTFNPMRGVLRIDYIFYSDDFESVRYDSPSVPWSDHNPVIARLRFREPEK